MTGDRLLDGHMRLEHSPRAMCLHWDPRFAATCEYSAISSGIVGPVSLLRRRRRFRMLCALVSSGYPYDRVHPFMLEPGRQAGVYLDVETLSSLR